MSKRRWNVYIWFYYLYIYKIHFLYREYNIDINYVKYRNSLINNAKKYKVHVQSINDKINDKPVLLAVGPGIIYISLINK